jgi:hypothetical protein
MAQITIEVKLPEGHIELEVLPRDVKELATPSFASIGAMIEAIGAHTITSNPPDQVG